MSVKLIDHSPDLKKLRDDGYEIKVEVPYLLVSGVPYFNSKLEICYGTLVTDITMAGNKTTRPSNHVIHFIGEHPYNKNGTIMSVLTHNNARTALTSNIIVDRSFSNKPKEGYKDYYEKITSYINVISAPVRSIDYSISAQTYKLVESLDPTSVFNYPDTNTSRAEIGVLAEKLENQRVAIIGLGGTGSYILDFIAKTPVAEIHLFDADRFQTHNAFRAPGAPDMQTLIDMPYKVDYLSNIYSKMHKHIIPHPIFVSNSNLNEINDLNFVFICIDKGSIKKEIITFLNGYNIKFVDVGMGLELTDNNSIIGLIRVTSSGDNGEINHIVDKHLISFTDGGEEDILYRQNIQIAELNALNATLAIIKWKKMCGFYYQSEHEKHSLYSLDDNSILNNDFNS